MEKMLEDLLKKAGLRRTLIRATVLEVLKEAKAPFSHQELMQKKALKAFDRVTVYRTLEAFHAANFLHKVLGADGVWRFCFHHDDEKKCQGNHIHFYCRLCHQMACLPDQALPWIKAPKGALIESKQLLVHGLCANCALIGKKKAK